MNAESLAAIAGIVLSLLFRIVPGLAPWFEKLQAEQMAAFQVGITALVAAGIYAVNCYGPYDMVACDSGGVWELGELLAKAVVANQVTHVATTPFRPYEQPSELDIHEATS